jgi:nickel/cobalt transporter (NiCoT) family protein
VSVVVAVIVGGLETHNLIGDEPGPTNGGRFWGAIGAINDNFGIPGYVGHVFGRLGWFALQIHAI